VESGKWDKGITGVSAGSEQVRGEGIHFQEQEFHILT